ncbi:succinate dehydrogenase subunit 5, mitochondrial-like isoform X1 [Canna indica]|uniref:Succinate dehydrogenase subunit 5, mitochondrial-like isoform X1 n=1 Tax=Canna indica TaxID=4628 RepID=A0AAQ3KVY6_9LILI|nr:succinate dehydrogenase subunit 5, mitochondrial-like isoform X1 [Canna indica]
MAMASLRREGKRLLLLPQLSSKSSIAARSVIFSDEFGSIEVRTISTQAVKNWMNSAKSIQKITALNLQTAQIRTDYSHGIWQPFSAVSGGRTPFTLNLRRAFSSDINQLPPVTDPEIEAALKDLLAMNWDEIPETVINETKKALSKATEDRAGQEALQNVFRAAEASVEFGGVLVSLRMALDDLAGLSGENVGHLPEHLEDAIRAAYKRYVTYLDSFSPDETFLRKKVELELGTKMIHLKMRCSGIGSEWGKVTLIGTSGLSGSYVELRS